MGIGRLIGHLIKGKILVATTVGAILVGGTTVAMAATPIGQDVAHTIIGAHDSSLAGEHTSQDQHHDNAKDATANNHKGKCSGLDEAQKLTARFSLSTANTSDGTQAICSLHEGTFRGKTLNGTSVSSDRVFGYGEIDQLLTHAKDLATHDTAHKLTDSNIRSYLAEALQSSDNGKKNNPESTVNEKDNNHGNSDTNNNNHGNSNTNNNNHGNSNTNNNNHGNNTGEGHGKPTDTPTSSAHN